MIIEHLQVGMFLENTYLIGDPESKEAAVIDPGDEADRILAAAEKHGLAIKVILLTHAHLDHVLAVPAIKKATGAPIWLHQNERDFYESVESQARMFGLPLKTDPPPPVDHWTQPGDEISWGGITAKALSTPGHSPGHISFLLNDEAGTCLSGDAVFRDSIGRTDLPGADHQQLLDSIKREILALPDETPLLCGHGPSTTVGRERRQNIFLQGL